MAKHKHKEAELPTDPEAYRMSIAVTRIDDMVVENPQPIPLGPDPIAAANNQDIIDSNIIDMLKQVLLATRVRSVAGFKPFRCLACDRPHVNGRCPHDCIHHHAIKMLKHFGIDTTGLVDSE